MQTETRTIATVLGLAAAAVFLGAIFSPPKQRAGLVGLATLGLGLTNAFLRIGQKERTAR